MLPLSQDLTCKDADALLHLYADEEAAPEDRAVLEAHLSACSECRGRLSELRGIQRAMQERGRDVQVPAAFVARLRGDLEAAARRESHRSSARLLVPALLATGLALAVGVTLSALPGDEGGLQDEGPLLLEEALSLHALDVPVDVASPDPARVSAFLAARVGHPVRVPGLSAQGLGLAGGRVSSLGHRRAAHLVYQGGLSGRVSLVAVPDPDGRLAARVNRGAEQAALHNAAFAGWVKGTNGAGHLRTRRGDVAVHLWSEGGAVYSLAGALEDQDLDRVIAAVSQPSRTTTTPVARASDPPLAR